MAESPFREWDSEKVKEALEERGIPAAHGAFYQGDHWQDGDGWVGPVPSGQGDEVSFALSDIERAFVSRNAIKEVVERAASGCTARSVAWGLIPRRVMSDDEQPSEQEAMLMLEARSLLMQWIEEHRAEDILRQAAKTMLWSGRGPIRLFVPAGELEEGGVPPGDMAESLARIYLHEDLDPEQTGVVRDARTQKEAAIHVYTDDDDREVIELAYVEDEMTVLRVMGEGVGDKSQDGGNAELGEWIFPLGGRLPIFEMKRDPLITPQMISQQKMLNLALTMMQNNVILGGFLERIFLNAQLPGHYEEDTGGTRRFVPDPVYVGAGTTNALVGVVTKDENGNERITTPSVVYRDPVAVRTFRDTRAEAYMGVLAEAHQLHYAMTEDATASGESRKTAMADYIVDLLLTKAQVERAWAWLLETALTMAAVFAGQPERYAELRITAQAQMDAGPISAEMMRVVGILTEGDDPLISRETGLSWVGVDDVPGELARLRQEREERIARTIERQQALQEAGVVDTPGDDQAEDGEETPRRSGERRSERGEQFGNRESERTTA